MIVKVVVTCYSLIGLNSQRILGNRELKAPSILSHASFCLDDDDTDAHDDEVRVGDGIGKSLTHLPPHIIVVSDFSPKIPYETQMKQIQ